MKFPVLYFGFISFIVASYIPREFINHKNFHLLFRGEDCGYSMASYRIVGGKEATPGQYPWIARVGISLLPDGAIADDFRCAGIIISDLYILTAAHCNQEKFKWTTVRLGEHDSRNAVDCDENGCLHPPQDIAISDYVCHAGFDMASRHHDICIIRLMRPITFNVSVEPICLPFYNNILEDYLPSGENLEVAGWGYNIPEHKEFSDILLRLVVPAVDIKKCIKVISNLTENPPVITDRQICAGGILGETSCNGDSGGPLMKPYSLAGSPRYFLLGVVSFGQKNCGDSEVPAIYTDVRRYMHWILDNLPTD